MMSKLTAALPRRWGHEAIYHPYLYHLTRLDHRHNFSPYFYPIYLLTSSPSSPSFIQGVIRSPLASFVPQTGLSTVLSWAYGNQGELAMAWTVSTIAFVTFNKVVTSQVRLLLCHPMLTSMTSDFAAFSSISSGTCLSCRSSSHVSTSRARSQSLSRQPGSSLKCVTTFTAVLIKNQY